MVERRMCTLLVCGVIWLCLGAGPTIESVRVVPDTVHIKPCEPLCLVMDVTFEAPAEDVTIENVTTKLAKTVVIDGRAYENQWHGINAAAIFAPNESIVRQISAGTHAADVIVLLYWNLEDEDFLFTTPGEYDVQFGEWTGVTVIVDMPTEEEQQVIAQMREVGLALAMFIIDPYDNRAVELLPRVQPILENDPQGVYAKYLSIACGRVMLRRIGYDESGKQLLDWRRRIEEKAKCARQYLEPWCSGEIDSLFEAGGVYALARVRLEQFRLAREGEDQGEAENLRREAETLLRKLLASPYCLERAPKVASLLKELESATE
jgi:hypothetical protein